MERIYFSGSDYLTVHPGGAKNCDKLWINCPVQPLQWNGAAEREYLYIPLGTYAPIHYYIIAVASFIYYTHST